VPSDIRLPHGPAISGPAFPVDRLRMVIYRFSRITCFTGLNCFIFDLIMRTKIMPGFLFLLMPAVFYLLPTGFSSVLQPQGPPVYQCDNGWVQFSSEAPLELIEASSKRLRGVLDPSVNAFAWSVPVKSFEGFNSPLQREHFNENYMESTQYPDITFEGKIIEKLDFSQPGSYQVRAKGRLKVHGVVQERIIKSQIEIGDDRITIQASFSVPLLDHDISIPKIVHQKIAEEIKVEVRAVLRKKT
jgi:hypothetical protein